MKRKREMSSKHTNGDGEYPFWLTQSVNSIYSIYSLCQLINTLSNERLFVCAFAEKGLHISNYIVRLFVRLAIFLISNAKKLSASVFIHLLR